MESRGFGYWLQITANFSLLAGLLLVGFQIKQASDLQKIQIFRDESISYIATEAAIAGENAARIWAKSIESPENITLEEARILESILWAHYVYRWMANYRLHQMGLLDDEEWKRDIRSDVFFAFGNPYAKAWWHQLTQVMAEEGGWFTREFAAFVTETIEAMPNDWTERHIEAPQRYLPMFESPQS